MLNRIAKDWPLLLVAVAASLSALGHSTRAQKAPIFSVDEKTAVRFFFQPDDGDYFHFPLVFSVVSEGDPRLNTAPMGEQGRMAYILSSEMRQMLEDLARSRLLWNPGPANSLGSFKKLQKSRDMVITYVSLRASATASVEKNKICETLKALEPAIETPRALWELQRFELNYNCKVPDFNYHKYPDH